MKKILTFGVVGAVGIGVLLGTLLLINNRAQVPEQITREEERENLVEYRNENYPKFSFTYPESWNLVETETDAQVFNVDAQTLDLSFDTDLKIDTKLFASVGYGMSCLGEGEIEHTHVSGDWTAFRQPDGSFIYTTSATTKEAEPLGLSVQEVHDGFPWENVSREDVDICLAGDPDSSSLGTGTVWETSVGNLVAVLNIQTRNLRGDSEFIDFLESFKTH